MPNMKKITAPRRTTIKGQPHQLAYINDAEQGLLLALGGSGRPVNGVPAYFTDDDEAGAGDFGMGPDGSEDSSDTFSDGDDFDAGLADTTGAIEGVDFGGGGASDGITAEQVAAMAQAQQNLGISPYTPPENVGYDPVSGMPYGLETVVAPNGQLVTTNLAGLTQSQTENLPAYMNIAGLMGSDPYAYEIDPVSENIIGQIGTPPAGFIGQGISALQNMLFGPPQTLDDLLAMGAYTGLNSPDMSGGPDGGPEEVKPVNPLTGTCEDGYIFDDDLNACRLATGSSGSDSQDGTSAPEDGLYFRRSILDDAPKFMPAGMNFDEMNRNFRRAAAYNPDNYENQMNTTGFSLLT